MPTQPGLRGKKLGQLLPIEGFWDYDGEPCSGADTFSVRVFQWVRTADRSSLKESGAVKRIKGKTSDPSSVYEEANSLCQLLEEQPISLCPFEEIRENVASLNSTPRDTLSALSKDPSERVRIEVARNKNTDRAVLEQLSQDSSKLVRIVVAGNVNTNYYVRDNLKQDSDSDVAFAAKDFRDNKNRT